MRIDQQKCSVAGLVVMTAALLSACGGGSDNRGEQGPDTRLATPSRSTSIALTSDDRRVVVANRDSKSLSVIEVRNDQGQDVANKLAEISVGQEPRYVAISPDDSEAYVANTLSGTVSVVSLVTLEAEDEIAVGVEPRGVAVTPNGTRLYVTHHTAGTVSEVNLATREVTRSIAIGGRPLALAITNDGDADDQDETVFVAPFYGELIPGGPDEASDTGGRGVVQSFAVVTPGQLVETTLAPLANAGFITQDPQGAFPNQLFAALIRGTRLYLPSIGAAPEPPTQFNINVQALVSVVDTATRTEVAGLSPFNLNNPIELEMLPAAEVETTVLTRVSGNDIVAIDANRAGDDFLMCSRGGNYLLRATADANGLLNIGAPDTIRRYQTGHIPSGVVISTDGRRAYSNNEVGVSVTAVALDTDQVLARDIAAGDVPAPGTTDHEIVMGKLGFFTTLGIPDNDFDTTPIREVGLPPATIGAEFGDKHLQSGPRR